MQSPCSPPLLTDTTEEVVGAPSNQERDRKSSFPRFITKASTTSTRSDGIIGCLVGPERERPQIGSSRRGQESRESVGRGARTNKPQALGEISGELGHHACPLRSVIWSDSWGFCLLMGVIDLDNNCRKLPDRNWSHSNVQAMALSLLHYPPSLQASRHSHSGGHVCTVCDPAPMGFTYG